MEKYPIDWGKFTALIEAATGTDDERVLFRKKMQYGTPETKMRLLEEEFGLTFEELVKIHEELEKVFYKGSLPWWFW
jgi:hypothetical protein